MKRENFPSDFIIGWLVNGKAPKFGAFLFFIASESYTALMIK